MKVSSMREIKQMNKVCARRIRTPTPSLLQGKNELNKHVKDALDVQIYQGHSHYDALRDDGHTFQALRNPT